MRGGLHAWLTSVPQDLKSISFVEGKEGEREIPSPPHTHLTHKLKIQTTSNISSDPTFLPWLPSLLPLFSLAIYCVSPLLPFLSAFSQYQTFLSWPLKLLHSPWVAIFTDSTNTCSVKTTQAPCSSQVSPSNTRLLLPMTCRSSPPSTSR